MNEPSFFAMSSFRSFLLLFSLLFVSFVSAQHANLSQQQEPGWVKITQPNLSASLPEDQASGFYYLLADTQKNLATDEYYHRYTYKILNNSGVQEMSDLSIDFDPAYQKVTIHRISIIRDGVRINKYDPANIQVVQRETNMERKLYDGRLTIITNLSDTRAGDIIDYSYTVTGSNPVYQGNFQAFFTLRFNVDAHQDRTSILVPGNEEIRYRKFHGAKEPEIEKVGEFTTYTWENFDLEKHSYEDNTPSWYHEVPAIEITQFETWGDVAGLLLPSYTLRNNERKQLKLQVEKLLGASKSEKEFIENAVRLVQDEVRYLGLESGANSHIPTKPVEVLQRRYGDCKDKSFLLSEILQAGGIEAYPMLVHSFNGRNLTQSLPSPNAFDHCVVQIDLGGKGTKYIDPTISEQGGELDNIHFPDYRNGLVLRPGTTDLISLPEYQQSKTNITETFELDDVGGGANLLVETIYRGETADNRRKWFQGASLQSIQKDYTAFYKVLYPGIKTEGQLYFEDDRKGNELRVFEKYRIDSLWTGTENQHVIQAQFYPLSIEDYLFPAKATERQMPYFLDRSLDLVHKTIVYVPVAWTVKNDMRSVKNEYFTWDLDIKYKNATLEITHRYKTLNDHVPPGDLTKFVEDHNKLQEDLHYYLTYNNRVAGAAEAGSTSWAAVIFMLFLLAGSGILCFLVYRSYDLPSKVDARHERKIGGWLILLAIGLIVTPFMAVGQLLSGTYFTSSVWISFFSSPETFSMAFLLGAELAYYSLLLVFSLFVLVLFFMRRTIAPRMMIILYSASLIFSGLLAFITLSLHPEVFGGPEKQDLYLELSKMGIRCAIFIPYLLYSTRVEETFVKTRKKDKKQPENDFQNEIPMPMMR